MTVVGLEEIAIAAGWASWGVVALRAHAQHRLRAFRPVWQAYHEVPKPDREHREWLVDLVARGRGEVRELDEIPPRFREMLLAVTRDQLAEWSYSLVTRGWAVLGLLFFLGFFLESPTGLGVWVLGGSVGIAIARDAYGWARSSGRMSARIAVLEESLAALPSAGAAGELE